MRFSNSLLFLHNLFLRSLERRNMFASHLLASGSGGLPHWLFLLSGSHGSGKKEREMLEIVRVGVSRRTEGVTR